VVTGLRRLDADLDVLTGTARALRRLTRRQAELSAHQSPDLPRHPQHRQAVAAVGQDGDLEHRVAGRDDPVEGLADTCVRVQHQDSVVVLAEA